MAVRLYITLIVEPFCVQNLMHSLQKKYGLTRDELRYVLDPVDVKGEDYPSETFRGLKNKEIQQYGEYRTQRLVLGAFDKMTGN